MVVLDILEQTPQIVTGVNVATISDGIHGGDGMLKTRLTMLLE